MSSEFFKNNLNPKQLSISIIVPLNEKLTIFNKIPTENYDAYLGIIF